jgi:hypothetical protein
VLLPAAIAGEEQNATAATKAAEAEVLRAILEVCIMSS